MHGPETLHSLFNRWAKEAEVEVEALILLSELIILPSKVACLPLGQIIVVLEFSLSPLNCVLQHADLIIELSYGYIHLQLHLLTESMASIGLLSQLLLELYSSKDLHSCRLGPPFLRPRAPRKALSSLPRSS
ncbi:hypothetical protein ACOSQ3_013685 [Xanthoceras sorbifolium]